MTLLSSLLYLKTGKRHYYFQDDRAEKEIFMTTNDGEEARAEDDQRAMKWCNLLREGLVRVTYHIYALYPVGNGMSIMRTYLSLLSSQSKNTDPVKQWMDYARRHQMSSYDLLQAGIADFIFPDNIHVLPIFLGVCFAGYQIPNNVLNSKNSANNILDSLVQSSTLKEAFKTQFPSTETGFVFWLIPYSLHWVAMGFRWTSSEGSVLWGDSLRMGPPSNSLDMVLSLGRRLQPFINWKIDVANDFMVEELKSKKQLDRTSCGYYALATISQFAITSMWMPSKPVDKNSEELIYHYRCGCVSSFCNQVIVYYRTFNGDLDLPMIDRTFTVRNGREFFFRSSIYGPRVCPEPRLPIDDMLPDEILYGDIISSSSSPESNSVPVAMEEDILTPRRRQYPKSTLSSDATENANPATSNPDTQMNNFNPAVSNEKGAKLLNSASQAPAAVKLDSTKSAKSIPLNANPYELSPGGLLRHTTASITSGETREDLSMETILQGRKYVEDVVTHYKNLADKEWFFGSTDYLENVKRESYTARIRLDYLNFKRKAVKVKCRLRLFYKKLQDGPGWNVHHRRLKRANICNK